MVGSRSMNQHNAVCCMHEDQAYFVKYVRNKLVFSKNPVSQIDPRALNEKETSKGYL